MKPHPIAWYQKGKTVLVHDKMQNGYSYNLDAPYGKITDPEFIPQLTPQQMLKLGVFEGKYLNDCRGEFPEEWYQSAKLSQTGKPEPSLNFFRIKSRQSLQEWERKHWIIGPDVRGWFQWYCRYFLGRRIPEVDKIQIRRWRAFARHRGQVLKHCEKKDWSCRPRQRQALLQWAYDPFI